MLLGWRVKLAPEAEPKEKATPRYSIEVSAPGHVRHEIHVTQFLMGTEGNYTWVWDIENRSTWPAFIIIKKDGVLLN